MNSYRMRVGPADQCLYKRKEEMWIQTCPRGRRPREEGDRAWRDADPRQ